MKHLSYLFVLFILLFNCSSEDDGNEPNDTTPGPFSVTILETRTDGASIEWTEAIDIDDDPVTYSIYLNDALISTGGIALAYNFTGLESETLYEGSIIADDGRGGTSQDDFFFVTEPEVLNLTIGASNWIYESYPEAGGTRELHAAGFEIPVYADAVSYRLEVLDYSMVRQDGMVFTTSGGIYTWTNESQNYPVVFRNETGQYEVRLATASTNTISGSGYDGWVAYMSSAEGAAQVTIYF